MNVVYLILVGIVIFFLGFASGWRYMWKYILKQQEADRL